MMLKIENLEEQNKKQTYLLEKNNLNQTNQDLTNQLEELTRENINLKLNIERMIIQRKNEREK